MPSNNWLHFSRRCSTMCTTPSTRSAIRTTALRLRAEDLPPALRHRFIGVTGKYLLQVYPKNDVWQRDKQKEFVEQLRIDRCRT